MNETKTIDVLDVKGKKAGSAELPGDLFDVNTNIPLIHQVVVAQLAAARQGTHATKTRGQVSGGGKKPWRQKGTTPPRRWWPLLCVGPCLIWLATTASSS